MSTSAMPDESPVQLFLPDVAGSLLTALVVDDGREVLVHVTGEIDRASCGRLRDALEPHLGAGRRVVLELSGVTFTDSSLLPVLTHAHARLADGGATLIVRNPSRAAHRVLSATGMTKLLAIEVG
jgi:anti-anti-sigma factor